MGRPWAGIRTCWNLVKMLKMLFPARCCFDNDSGGVHFSFSIVAGAFFTSFLFADALCSSFCFSVAHKLDKETNARSMLAGRRSRPGYGHAATPRLQGQSFRPLALHFSSCCFGAGLNFFNALCSRIYSNLPLLWPDCHVSPASPCLSSVMCLVRELDCWHPVFTS